MEYCSDTIGDRPRGFRACSTIPRPTASPHVSFHYGTYNIMLPSAPRSSKLSLPFTFHYHRDPLRISPLPKNATLPAHVFLLHLITLIIFSVGPGSVVGIATGYGLDGPGIESRWGARFSAPVQTGPGAHTASCTMSTGSFPGVKTGRGVTLTPHPLLVPWSWKSRAIPLLPLWAVRPVQSLSACTRVTFTFTWHLQFLQHLCTSNFMI